MDRRLEIARRTLTSRGEYMDLAKVRFEGGVTSEIDYRQALAEYHRIDATVADLERLAAEKENELSVLLGRNPTAIPRGQSIDAQAVPVEVPAGLPSELLERRPISARRSSSSSPTTPASAKRRHCSIRVSP